MIAGETIALEFLAAQQCGMLAKMAAMRDDMRVLSAIVDQLRAMVVQQQSRVAARVLACKNAPNFDPQAERASS